MSEMRTEYLWVPFFNELSVALAEYEEKQDVLIGILREAGVDNGLRDRDENGNSIDLAEIDPFTFFALILKYGDERRNRVFAFLRKVFNLVAQAPESFEGVPTVNAQRAWYFGYKAGRPESQIPLLWQFFRQVIVGEESEELFKALLSSSMIGLAKLTAGMFCVKPEANLPLNRRTVSYLESVMIDTGVSTLEEYKTVLSKVQTAFPNKELFQISYDAWEFSQDESLSLDEIERLDKLWDEANISSLEPTQKMVESNTDEVNIDAGDTENTALGGRVEDVVLNASGEVASPETNVDQDHKNKDDVEDKQDKPKRAIYNNLTLMDSDAVSKTDYLNRKNFAEYLAGEINHIVATEISAKKKEDKSSILNVYGSWGAGKSTFVEMVVDKLKTLNIELGEGDIKESKQWMFVRFNAWKNQHVQPVWWSLLSRFSEDLSNQATNPRSRWCLKAREFLWRFNLGYGGWVLGILLIIWLFLSIDFSAKDITPAKNMIGLATGLVTILGSFTLAVNALFSGGHGVAKLFQNLHRDPFEHVRKHFTALIDRHDGRPVFVFIDDLDRCKSEYVVQLLESLHTLFSDRRVIFMVAADRVWVSSCFNEVYGNNDNKETITSTKGYLFIEKIFQLSFSLPSVSEEVKKKYINRLLSPIGEEPISEPDAQEVEDAAQAEMEEANNEEELAKIKARMMDRGLEQEMLERLAQQVASTDRFRESRAHNLNRFASLMDSNPRNIKLLINAYGIYIRLYQVEGEELEFGALHDVIALWSILNIRFPRMAEVIEKDLDLLDRFHKYYITKTKAAKTKLYDTFSGLEKELVENTEVAKILTAEGVEFEGERVQLTATRLSQILG